MKLTFTACAAAALLVAGCSTARLPGPAAPAPRAPSEPVARAQSVPPPTSEEEQYLQRLYADPRLDPIRDKVPLVLRAQTVTPAHLANNTKPDAREKEAIRVWLEVRERAQAYQAAKRGPPSADLARMRMRVTQAIVQLQAGRLTYAAFSHRLQTLDAEYQASVRQAQGPAR
jgi:hypothetical protein